LGEFDRPDSPSVPLAFGGNPKNLKSYLFLDPFFQILYIPPEISGFHPHGAPFLSGFKMNLTAILFSKL
jgi:hypothetical protein